MFVSRRRSSWCDARLPTAVSFSSNSSLRSTLLAATLGVEVKVKPQKIVAGLEPEETNAFLQLLAKAAKKQVCSERGWPKICRGGNSQPELSDNFLLAFARQP
ncbi:MAG: hypothetical protein BJ554DRAFT_1719 [Olpidium bornovanus]|uniref:TRAF3-interacting protein 1 N-terminal domain-containing protein n=1 Tax=Olpidium bornovanus TaxID=278681 RepID=A0A8H8DH90_9FUNG|nr:MAG: hypothetical protein BJ554DRAFT_1719 [Olpidium bornovanus]